MPCRLRALATRVRRPRDVSGHFLAIVVELPQCKRVLDARFHQRFADDRLATAHLVVALFHRQLQVEDRVARVTVADPARDHRRDPRRLLDDVAHHPVDRSLRQELESVGAHVRDERVVGDLAL
jgi:hypothetical protein